MNHMLYTKVVPIVFSEAIVDNAALTTAEVDRLGFDYCSIYLRVGTTDIAAAVCKIQETDTSGSAYSDVVDLASATDIEGGATAVPSGTADNTWRVIHIDCRNRKRYLDLALTAGDGSAGSWFFAFAILSRAKQAPTTNVGCAGTGGVVICI